MNYFTTQQSNQERTVVLDATHGFAELCRQLETLSGPHAARAALQRAGFAQGVAMAHGCNPTPTVPLALENWHTQLPAILIDQLRRCLAVCQASGFGSFRIDMPARTPDMDQGALSGWLHIYAHNTLETWSPIHSGMTHEPICAYTAGVLAGCVSVIVGRTDIVCIERVCQSEGHAECCFEVFLVDLLPPVTDQFDMHFPGSNDMIYAQEAQVSRRDAERTMGLIRANEWLQEQITAGVRAYEALKRHIEERTQELMRRRLVAEGLRDVLTVLNSDRSLDEILKYIVTQAIRLLDMQAAAVYRLQPEDDLLAVQAYQGLPDAYADVKLHIGQGATGVAVQTRQPTTLIDSVRQLEFSQDMQPHEQDLIAHVKAGFQTILSVPLIVKDEVYGGITVYHPEARTFTSEEIALAVSFADQAALAIENARLREQAGYAATLAERSRLARDLHDAVTQTLFSASLIAEVLPRLWERNPDIGRQRLEELRQLTRGALAEMRTLLLELRPATLTEIDLAELLRQLVEATTGRARLPVTLTIVGQPAMPADVRISFYRIAQEALHNVAKHSGASQATVALHAQPGNVTLCIRDNGSGFDLDTVSPDRMGLRIMRERAEAIGARLSIESNPGMGTWITVTWNGSVSQEAL